MSEMLLLSAVNVEWQLTLAPGTSAMLGRIPEDPGYVCHPIPHPTLARRQARVFNRADRWYVEPIFKQEVHKNGERIYGEQPIDEGDRIRLGHVEIAVQIKDSQM